MEDEGGLWVAIERTPSIIAYSVVCNFDRENPANWDWHIPYSFNDYYNQLNDLLKL
jgi:hypothetical protein